MSLFIVNFHWQTYSCNISFQAQRLERLRKERQNQIKCKNIQWKDRNTSYSGKRKYLLFSCCSLFLPLVATTFAVCNFPLGFQGTEKCQFLVLSWGASRALHRVNKAKESRRCWRGSLVWGSGEAALGFSPGAVLCLSPRALGGWGQGRHRRLCTPESLCLPSLLQQRLAHGLGWRIVESLLGRGFL